MDRYPRWLAYPIILFVAVPWWIGMFQIMAFFGH